MRLQSPTGVRRASIERPPFAVEIIVDPRCGGGLAIINRQGQKAGRQRGNRQRFPYEPRVVGGKLLMPAELQAIHRYVVETPVLKTVTEEIRAVVETVRPELRSKLPPKS
jgi:hypothetical protein